jgi:hypothetical protein
LPTSWPPTSRRRAFPLPFYFSVLATTSRDDDRPDLVRWLSYRLGSRVQSSSTPIGQSIQSRSDFISALFKSRRFWAPPSFLSTTTFEPKSAHIRSQPYRSSPLPTAAGPTDGRNLRLRAQSIHPPRCLRSLALIHPTMPSFSKLSNLAKLSKLSKLSSKAKSLFARSSPIVLISEPMGLVVNSVRHLPNGDVSLFSRLLCLCLCRLVFLALALALGDGFFFSPSSSAHPSRVEPGITPRVWSRPLTRKTPSTGTTGISRSSWSTRAPTYLLPTHVLPTHPLPTHLVPIHLLATSAHP